LPEDGMRQKHARKCRKGSGALANMFLFSVSAGFSGHRLLSCGSVVTRGPMKSDKDSRAGTNNRPADDGWEAKLNEVLME